MFGQEGVRRLISFLFGSGLEGRAGWRAERQRMRERKDAVAALMDGRTGWAGRS
jgi:hypothetical protein